MGSRPTVCFRRFKEHARNVAFVAWARVRAGAVRLGEVRLGDDGSIETAISRVRARKKLQRVRAVIGDFCRTRDFFGETHGFATAAVTTFSPVESDKTSRVPSVVRT